MVSSMKPLARKSSELAVVLIFSTMPVSGQDSVDWSSVDGGGELFMADPSGSTDWEVSGTFGQWDATEAEGAKGANWEVTGGFWSLSVDQTDYLFSDGFEG